MSREPEILEGPEWSVSETAMSFSVVGGGVLAAGSGVEGRAVVRWDSATKTWSEGAGPPIQLAAYVLTGAADGRICLRGFDGLACYDVAADDWPLSRAENNAVLYPLTGWQGKIVLSDDGLQIVSQDVPTGATEALAQFPHENGTCGLAMLGELDGALHGAGCTSVHEYTPADDQWVLAGTSTMDIPFSRFTAAVGGKLCSYADATNQMGCFDPEIDLFEPRASPPESGESPAITTAGGFFFFSFQAGFGMRLVETNRGRSSPAGEDRRVRTRA